MHYDILFNCSTVFALKYIKILYALLHFVQLFHCIRIELYLTLGCMA